MADLNIKKDIAVIDLETTTISAYEGEITEVAIITLDGMTGEQKSVFSTLLKIKAETIDKKNIEITGITKEMTEQYGMGFDEVKAQVTQLLKDKIIVAHNLSFEASWLRVHFDIDIKMFYDTLSIDRLEHQNEKSHKLEDACSREGITILQAHRAIYDAVATAQLIVKQLTGKNDIRKKYINLLTETQYGLDYKPASTRVVEPYARR